jgi:hypothetical protein
MATLRSVIIQIEYPDGMLNTDDSSPTGSGATTPLTELSKIIVSGCGSIYTCEQQLEKHLGFDAIFVIREV